MILYFLIYPQNALMASRRGLTLWFEQILPTLLPFSVISYIVLHSNLFSHPAHEKNIVFFAFNQKNGMSFSAGFSSVFQLGASFPQIYMNIIESSKKSADSCMLYQQSQPGVRYFGPRQSAALFFSCSIFPVVVWHTSLHMPCFIVFYKTRTLCT